MTEQTQETTEDEIPLNAAEEAVEFAKTMLIALTFALIIRMFIFEPFNIPSGSMKPSLLVGDYLVANKHAYGYGQYSFSLFLNKHVPAPFEGRIWTTDPKRGDVVVFYLPEVRQNYIKRVVGLPGETIQVKRGRLYINDKLVPREPVGLQKDNGTTMVEYIETLPDGILHRIYERGDDEPLDNTQLFTVPEDHYFMMGDNRDNSQDSRVQGHVGFVPFKNMVGRADRLFYSTNGSAKLFEVWKWPWTVRYDRIFSRIGPVRPAPEDTAEIE